MTAYLKPKHTPLIVYICLLAAVIGAMAGIRKCCHPPIIASGELRVAITNSPLSYHTNGDSIDGINYRLLKEYADSKGLTLKLVPILNLKKAFRALSSGHYDLIASYPVDPALLDSFAVTRPIFIEKLFLISSGNPETILDIDSVNILKDSPAYIEIAKTTDRLKKHITINEISGASIPEILNDLTKNKNIAAIISQSELPPHFLHNDSIHILARFSQFHVWYTDKDNKIVRHELECWLKQISNSEKYRLLLKNHRVLSPR